MKRSICLILATAALGVMLTGCDRGGYVAPSLPGAPARRKATKSGQYTVLLKVFSGPGHSRMANDNYLASLQTKLGWRGLFVVTEGDHSDLYWGSFKTAAAARKTLKRARAHRTQTGVAPFGAAIIAVMPGSDSGNPAWNVKNCPGEYTLLVAVFEDQPQAKPAYVGRREYATAYCSQLRSEGREAYYHHGPRSSSVTIGSFGADAVSSRREKLYPPNGGRPVMREIRTPVDPQLLALMEAFPNRAYNGRTFYNIRKDIRGQEISRKLAPSEVVHVPGRTQQ